MSTPRLLLFGTPGAGKSALLGALAQAAPALQADLVEKSGALQRLQKNTYDATLEPTEALESYQIRVQPEAGSDAVASEVTVLDCSGQSALQMLQAKEPFADSHPLKKPILAADAVMLVMDASRSGKELVEEFRQCAHWLKQLHEFRGQRTDVAELPVYFVLAKCDLLARKDDTFAAWVERIEERKKRFGENFRKYLKKEAPGFGTVKLKLSATAIKRPAFADRPARPQEPFGVAELFRECLLSANDFQERRSTAQGRLQNVLVGLIGLVAILGLAVFFLVEFQPPSKGTSLEEKLQMVLPKPDATAVERLQGTLKRLEEKAQKLAEIEESPDFVHLPSDAQQDVIRYRQELVQYLKLHQESQTVLSLPHLAKNDAELKELEKNVQAFALPDAHAKDWEETRLGKRLRHVRSEYQSLHAALDKETSWLRGQIDANKKLLIAGSSVYGKLLGQEKDARQEAKEWNRLYQTQQSARPPTPRDDNLPGVSQLSYEDLAKFEPVTKAQHEWKTSKDDLTNISALILKKLKAG
jgi:GTPase SAR1 family protein